MAGRGGYAALPHSAVECPQQPDGYGVYGSQRTTNPYNPQLQQVQQPGGYSGYGSQGTTNPYNPQLQQVQQPCGYSGYGSQGTTNPYNPQLQQVQQPGYCDPQQQYVQPPSYQSFLQCNLPVSQQPQPPFNPSAGYVPPLANFSNQHSNVNVVVCQPQNQNTSSVVPQAPRAKSYFTVAITLFMFCLMCGNLPALTCLIPALICAAVAAHHNRNGQYQSAQTCGKLAQSSSICMIVIITLLIIGWITLTILGLLLSAWNGF